MVAGLQRQNVVRISREAVYFGIVMLFWVRNDGVYHTGKMISPYACQEGFILDLQLSGGLSDVWGRRKAL
jgi:hypothetical protein